MVRVMVCFSPRSSVRVRVGFGLGLWLGLAFWLGLRLLFGLGLGL
jgi:hypothetical protein